MILDFPVNIQRKTVGVSERGFGTILILDTENDYELKYIEAKDIKDLNAVKNEMDFLKFIRILASRTGQMLNYTDIANEVGIAVNTIKSWVSILVSRPNQLSMFAVVPVPL